MANTSSPCPRKYHQKNRGCTRSESPSHSKKLYSATSRSKSRVSGRDRGGFTATCSDCSLPTSHVATVMPIHSRSNQRNGDLRRDCFFITTEPPSLMSDAFPFLTSIPSILSPALVKITSVMYSRNVSPPLQTFLSREIPR